MLEANLPSGHVHILKICIVRASLENKDFGIYIFSEASRDDTARSSTTASTSAYAFQYLPWRLSYIRPVHNDLPTDNVVVDFRRVHRVNAFQGHNSVRKHDSTTNKSINSERYTTVPLGESRASSSFLCIRQTSSI